MKLTYKIGLLVVITSMIFACTSDNNQTAVSPPTKQKTTSTPIGKPSAPISMTYNMLNSSPKPEEELNIEVNFQSSVDSPISVKMNSAEKLSWLNNDKNWQQSLNKSGERNTLPVMKVVAPENGTYYIRLVASVNIDGKMQSKAFVIPVKVGSDSITLEPVGKTLVDEKGQRVIIQKSESNN